MQLEYFCVNVQLANSNGLNSIDTLNKGARWSVMALDATFTKRMREDYLVTVNKI